jgi:hypothetical protein
MPWSIGQEYDSKPFSTSDVFQGVMDEVRIWNVARTPQQIRENMLYLLEGSERFTSRSTNPSSPA